MIKVSVLGCCVSREMLNYTNKVEVARCIYSSYVTLFEKEVPFSLQKIENTIQNNFYSKMVWLECSKNVFEYLKQAPVDFLIVDFAETVTDILTFVLNGNTYLLPATEHYKALLLQNNCPYNKISYQSCEIENIIERLFFALTEIFPLEKIILNLASYSKKYYENDSGTYALKSFSDHYRLQPERLRQVRLYESAFLKRMKGRGIVLEPIENCISDGNHKYGKSPVHYTETCYHLMAKRLEHVLGIATEEEMFQAYQKSIEEQNKMMIDLCQDKV